MNHGEKIRMFKNSMLSDGETIIDLIRNGYEINRGFNDYRLVDPINTHCYFKIDAVVFEYLERYTDNVVRIE